MRRFSRMSLLAGVVGATTMMPVGGYLFGQGDNQPVATPLVTVPQTPSEQISAALLLLKLSRADLAKAQVEAVVSANLDSAGLIALRDEFGTGVFLRLARNKDLDPAGSQLLDQITAAARSQSTADGYLDELLAGMDGNREDAAAAVREIRRLGPDAVVALSSRAGGDAAAEFRIERVLALLGDRATAPLADVVLVSSNPAERFLALRVLARTADVAQVPALVAVAGNPKEPDEFRSEALDGLKRLSAAGFTFDAAGSLKRVAREVLSGQERIPRDNDNAPLVYGVDPTAPAIGQTLQRLDLNEQQARHALALRYLEAAVRIDADDREALQMSYVLRLQSAGAAAAQTELLRRGPAAAEEILQLAMDLGQHSAATAALETIGLSGRRDAFAGMSPAATALNSPNPMVQFAAARAAVLVEPTHTFPNSPRVVQILMNRLAGEPERKVVVVDPNGRRGGDIGGRLRQIGFTPILAESGREGFRTAASRGDVVLAVVHANSIDWELTPTLANFAADSRTAAIPVAVVASTQARESLTWVRQQYPNLMYVPVLADSAGYREALKPAFAQIDQTPLPTAPDTRREAASLLRRIAEHRLTDLFGIAEASDALAQAAFDSDDALAVDAVTTLAYIPSPAIQGTMVDLIVGAPSLEVRQTAARSLVRHLSRYGSALDDAGVVRLAKADLAGDPILTRLVAASRGLLGR